MKIIIAPNAFKGSLSAWEAACCIEEGIKRALPKARCIKVPVADGGDGTVEALVRATGGKQVYKKVDGPAGKPARAGFGVLGDNRTGVIEMAMASGLALIPKREQNPLKTTTYGTGQLIEAAMDKGCRYLIVGIGGSATVDGGIGMAQALGIKFLDKSGKEVGRGGGALAKIKNIDISGLDKRMKKTNVVVACDVTNPLLGRNGSARIFGPQKGADPKMVVQLEAGLANLARVIKRDLGKDIKNIPGAGAAGGLGAGLMAFLDANLKSGIDLVIKAAELEQKMKGADLVITTEGCIDEQTAFGKAPAGVAAIGKKYKVPVVALGGQVAGQTQGLHKCGINAAFSIIRSPLTLEQAIKESKPALRQAAEQIIRLYIAGR